VAGRGELRPEDVNDGRGARRRIGF